MNAIDIMSTPVVSITPQTPVQQIAELMLTHHISGVPVVDKGVVVGLVNEFELLWRHELGTDGSAPEPTWWSHLFERDRRPVAYVKSYGRCAQDLMTTEVVSVLEQTPVSTIASIFAARSVRRLVVLREGQLVGIITRANLVQMLARRAKPQPRTQADASIRQHLLAELSEQPWWRPSQSTVEVHDGVVCFQGLIYSEDEREAARVAAENVPGVRSVDDKRTLWWAWQSMF